MRSPIPRTARRVAAPSTASRDRCIRDEQPSAHHKYDSSHHGIPLLRLYHSDEQTGDMPKLRAGENTNNAFTADVSFTAANASC